MPNKEAVRKWMQERQAQRTAPPPIEEIRRQLGWDLKPGKQKNDR